MSSRFSWKMPSIYWEDHSVDVMRLVGDMYQNNKFTDCSLDTEGRVIDCHKTILAACSPYMQKLFRDHHGKNIIPLKGVNYKDMKLILDFIYGGEMYVSDMGSVTDMGSLRRSAELLQIPSLQCAFQNFLDTFSSKNADEGGEVSSGTRFGQYFITHAKKETPVRVNRSIDSQDLHQNSDFGFNVSSQSIQQWSNGCERKAYCDTKSLSKEVKEDQSDISFTKTRVIKMDTVNNDSEIVEDELPPLSFVDISSVPLKDGDQITDSLLNNPLDIHPNDSVGINVENVKEETGQTELEIKQEIDVSELDHEITENDSIIKEIKSVSYADVSLGNEIKHSCDDLTTNVEQVGDIGSNPNETCERTVRRVCSGNCVFERTEDLQVKFESICDICEPDLKERKLFLTQLDVKNFNDDDPLSQKQGNEESHLVSMQDENHELDFATTSKLNLKDAIVVLQRIQLPYQVETGVDESAFNEAHRSSIVRKVSSQLETEVKKCSGNKESFKRSPPDAVFSSRQTCEHDSFHVADKVHFGSGNTHMKGNGDLLREKSFSCEVCDALFCYQCDLKIHMQTHTDEKCGGSGGSFAESCTLKSHMRTDAGEKRFQCVDCGVLFRHKWILNRHMRTHTGEKPFKCGVCGFSFREKGDLNKHMRTHTGEKPFRCGVCCVSFSRKGTLKSHMRAHTGEKPF